jgi:hypothetical protein
MEDVHGLFASQGLSKPRQKILCLGKLGFYSQRKESADEEILGLGGTESLSSSTN